MTVALAQQCPEAHLVSSKPRTQTDVGVVPDGWDLLPLSQLMDFQNGFNAEKSAYGKGVPFANVLEVITKAHLKESMIPGRVHVNSEQLQSFLVRAGDILFNRTSETQDEVGLASVYVGDKPIVFGGFVIRGRPKTDRLNPAYAGYALRSPIVRKQIIARGQGAVRANIGQSELGAVLVPCPPVNEQPKIASALLDIDLLIRSLGVVIRKKQAIKQVAMQSLLTGEVRLPGFNGEWEIKSLGDLGEVLIGLTYAPADVSRDGTLVLRSSNVLDGVLTFDDNVYVATSVPDRIMVRGGDILICVRNGSRDLIGKCAKIDDRCHGMTFGAFMAVYRTPYHDFLYHQFQSDMLKRQIHEHLGATINQITNKSLKSFTVPYPVDEKERNAISKVLTDMDAEIFALISKLRKARQIRQGMMQELLTGKVRLV